MKSYGTADAVDRNQEHFFQFFFIPKTTYLYAPPQIIHINNMCTFQMPSSHCSVIAV